MWTLLVWLNEKTINRYRIFKEAYKERYMIRRVKRLSAQQTMLSRKLPEYLRRDMGLPPYNSGHDSEKKQP